MNNNFFNDPSNYNANGDLKNPMLQQMAQQAMQAQAQQNANAQSGMGILGQYRPQDGYLSGGQYAEQAKLNGREAQLDNRELRVGEKLDRLNPFSESGYMNEKDYAKRYAPDGTLRSTGQRPEGVLDAQPDTHTMPDGTVMEGATHEEYQKNNPVESPVVPNPVLIPENEDPMGQGSFPRDMIDDEGVTQKSGMGILQEIGKSITENDGTGSATNNSRSNTATAEEIKAKKEADARRNEMLIRVGGAIAGGARQGGLSAMAAGSQEYGRLADYRRAQEQLEIENQLSQEEAARQRGGMTGQQQLDFDAFNRTTQASINEFDEVIAALQAEGDNVTGMYDGTFGSLNDSKFSKDPRDARRAVLRSRMKQITVDQTLLNTAKTKGAITEREMKLFKAPMPAMTDTEEKWIAWLQKRREALVETMPIIVARMRNGTQVDYGSSDNFALNDEDQATYQSLIEKQVIQMSVNINEVKQAAVDAFKAGDTDRAKQLAALASKYEQPATKSISGASSYADLPARPPEDVNSPTGGLLNTLKRGIDQPLEGFAETARLYGKNELADTLSNAVDSVEGESASGQFINEGEQGFDWRYLPKAGLEQTGQFLGAIASRGAGAALGGAAGSVIPGVGSAAGAIVGGVAAPVVFEAAQQLGSIANERARNNGRETPNADDMKWAYGSAAGSGVLNTLAPNMRGTLKRMLVEGGTEAAQSVVTQAGASAQTDAGLNVSAKQAVGEGIIGAGSAGMVDTATAPFKAMANRDANPVADPEAQSAFANRLHTIVKSGDENGNEFNVKDLDPNSNGGAIALVDSAHKSIAKEIDDLVVQLKDELSIDNTYLIDDDATRAKKVQAGAAIQLSKNKAKSVVTAEQMSAIQDLVGDTKEGQVLLNTIRESMELTRLHKTGYIGGVSKFTSMLNPFNSVGMYNATGQGVRNLAGIGTGLGATTGFTVPAVQLGIIGAGRVIDKITGKRSKVRTYLDNNKKGKGFDRPRGLSKAQKARAEAEREQEVKLKEANTQAAMAAQEEADLKEQTLRNFDNNYAPHPESPQGKYQSITGLDTAGMKQMIAVIHNDPSALPQDKKEMKSLLKSMRQGGRITGYGAANRMNAILDSDPEGYGSLRVAVPLDQQSTQAILDEHAYQNSPNYLRGKQDNQQLLESLSQALEQDSNISMVSKAVLKTAHSKMKKSLGLNPIVTLQEIESSLVSKNVSENDIATYFVPYRDRVISQQNPQQNQEQPQQQQQPPSPTEQRPLL